MEYDGLKWFRFCWKFCLDHLNITTIQILFGCKMHDKISNNIISIFIYLEKMSVIIVALSIRLLFQLIIKNPIKLQH